MSKRGNHFVNGTDHLRTAVHNELLKTGASFDQAGDGAVDSVFSSGFSSSPRSAMYQAWVYPELRPDERQPVLSNWSAEDLEAFCGIYAKETV